MRRSFLYSVGIWACWGVYQSGALANCPSGLPDEIFCDDFDTYCNESPGAHPGDPKCPVVGATRNDQRLSEVWLREPRDGCGVEVIIEQDTGRLTSPPFGGRYPCQGNAQLGPQTIRDWVNSPYPLSDPGQVRNLSWKIQAMWGVNNTAAVGTDDQPLILQYMVDGGGSDKIDWDNGYLEVTLDDADENSKLDTANVDYADSPDCNTYCNPYIQIEPMPIVCAQGNPDTSTAPMPAACPNVITNPPPIRHSIAVGVLSLTDTDPCHCGSTTAHGPVSYHLNVYDGQKWWILRSGSPQAGTGYVTDKFGNVQEPPYAAGLSTPGHFELNGASNGGKSFNYVTLTIRSTTFDVHLATFENDTALEKHYVHSEMTGLPRAYLGAFNALRMGVGLGCNILGTPNNPWSCGGSNTHCLRSRANSAGSLVFDDIILRGGAPVTEEGACCHADATCTDVLADQCTGNFRGRSTFCETLTEPCCPQIYGDTNADGDVDMEDFAVLQRCLTIGGGAINPACKCLNQNGDTAIDLVDVDRFIQCSNGPQTPGEIAPPCNGVGW